MMSWEILLPLCLGMALVAFLYSSVGHAGASGYIAVMALAGLAPQMIKPIALTLNILVAFVTAWNFLRRGHFSWAIFLPFALASVPMAFLGGYLHVADTLLRILIGCVLLYSSFYFLFHPQEPSQIHAPSKPVSCGAGGVLGLLSGMTGTGGGIFLTPLLLLMKWSGTKTAAGISALFILVNSSAGLAGHWLKSPGIPGLVWPMIACVLIGGWTGSFLGSNRFSAPMIKRLLSIVLFVAGLKLIFSR
ncbi:sulfite exporter TauE/SafE family protein [Kamptonema cortianum]|uniref:Probable membrane transporter protein n=1 Tax=Geitlerinema calcuttense NRMC-F 0142 TaxID=2922238 RepID=A0ABT7LY33_9CYAN|nr:MULTISPECIES: sulfite exporter TauE/SafE family protein [Cyanophyceae]MDK3157504.1 sulfite exporter TauE/SafE family protein [Kamptonema cortianum]MDL5052616.1 sulfite exporter TauE/SafE family protein [Oscillatoria laete-virens NRMC-F 0139]MDL5056920.1 sulfite exporter TauE/SafE family protein [Geitlerinema calcuttense NRMC-F 0142]